jgi:hypothetical protein
MLTPVLFNGVLKLQVPTIPWEHLIAFTALYLRTLYGRAYGEGDLRGSGCSKVACGRQNAAPASIRLGVP